MTQFLKFKKNATNYLSLNNSYFIATFCLLLLIYVVLRAIYVNPFCDEIGTFFDYIETGNIWEQTPNMSSANNHLLITYIARFFFVLFGNHMFLFRLISIFSLIIYFFASYFIVKSTIKSKFNVFVFIGLNTIAWIFDFFAYARGYAFALSVFLLCIYLVFKWKGNFKLSSFALILLLSWLCVFANLAYLNAVFVLISCIFLQLFLNFKELSYKSIIIHFFLIVMLFWALSPLINYSFELKKAGALWWGAKNNWWENSIAYIIELSFFIKNEFLKYVFYTLFISLIVWTGFTLKIKGFKQFLKSNKGIIICLFFGNLILTEILVVFFEVNYPSDRVAMILVPLFILILAFVFDSSKRMKFLMVLFLFFPVSFVYQINVESSVYMKNTRITEATFNKIKHRLEVEKSIEIDNLIYRNYVYEMRNKKNVVIANVLNEESYSAVCQTKYIADYNSKRSPTKDYQKIYYDVNSEGSLYVLKNRWEKKCIFDTVLTFENELEFNNLFTEKKIKELAPSGILQITIDGTLNFSERPKDFSLITSIMDSTNLKSYHRINMITYCEINSPLNFSWESPIYSSNTNSEMIRCYLWNLEKKSVVSKKLNVKIFELISK